MSSDEYIEGRGISFSDTDSDEAWDPVEQHDETGEAAHAIVDEPESVSLVVQSPEKKYSVDGSQQFSQYLNKDASSRYQAIVLNAWTGDYESPHYEVGLVQINNSDHRNGVVHALRVSPFHVNFISLDEAFFE